MQKLVVSLLLLSLIIRCDSNTEMPRGEAFVKNNFALLDSCTNYILEHIDTLLTCDESEGIYSTSIYEASLLIGCDFIRQDTFLQNVLKTDIEFISLNADSTITYILEGIDENNIKYAILYKKSRTAYELDWNPASGPLPDVVVENYYLIKVDYSPGRSK